MASSVVGNNAFLKVSSAELNNKSQQIDNKIQAMTDIMNEMKSCFDAIIENFQSTSGDDYKSKCDILIQEIKESLDNLSEYAADLKEAGNKVESNEGNIGGDVVGQLDDPSGIFNV